jgi:nitrous-oxide reductase
MNRKYFKAFLIATAVVAAFVILHYGCQESKDLTSGDAAGRVYVAPGTYDEFYLFTSGGFSGQIGVYGLPSGRLFRVIPVFSQDPEKAWGYSEESKPMFMTSLRFYSVG